VFNPFKEFMERFTPKIKALFTWLDLFGFQNSKENEPIPKIRKKNFTD